MMPRPLDRKMYSAISAQNADQQQQHPVNIDSRLGHDQRYRIVHLLGHSAFSTVWLAQDSQTSRYVAVKVCNPAHSESANRESEILSRLTSSIPVNSPTGDGETKSTGVQTLLDRFTISGPSGDNNHICLVSEPTRGSLTKSLGSPDYPRLPIEVARSLAAQLALAVSFMHSRGIVHGDLRINNALVQFSPASSSHINHLPVADLYAKYGYPESSSGNITTQRRERQDYRGSIKTQPPTPPAPPHGLAALQLSIPADQLTLSSARLVLADFRSSFDYQDSTEPRYSSHGPLGLQPPDLFLPPYPPLNFASDVWSLGNSIFHLLASDPLIDEGHSYFVLSDEDTERLAVEKGTHDLTDDDYEEAKRELQERGLDRRDAQGRRLVPTDWWDESGYMERLGWQLSSVDWDWRYDSGLSDTDTLEALLDCCVWEPRLLKEEDISEEEREMITALLRRLLAFRGPERPSAGEVLELDWMRKYGLPAYEEAKKSWDDI